MSLAAHVSSLELKHQNLDNMLNDEMHRPMPDFSVIQSLKKQKLLIKEELFRLNNDEEEYAGSQDGAA